MNSDFFVRLTLATHKVASILLQPSQTRPQQDVLAVQMRDSANKLLAVLLLLAGENPVTQEQKQAVLPRAIRELGVLIAYLNYAKRTTQINPDNFLVLEREYNKVGEFLRRLHQSDAVPEHVRSKASNISPVKSTRQTTSASKGELSFRQGRILELMRNKPKVQVWELQKVLPEVTKRTLRRDLDDLLQRSLIVRQGEWNEVFYQIR